MPRSSFTSSASRPSSKTLAPRGAPAPSPSIRASSPAAWVAVPARAASPAQAALKRRAMALWLKSGDADFEDRFKALLSLKREQAADVNDKVAAIIARVREEGDVALIDLTATYDGLDLGKAGIKIAAA